LHELGYRDGKNMLFDYRSADGNPEQMTGRLPLPQFRLHHTQA
jgi:hypothetical protein